MATTYDKASLVMIPSGVKESKLYSIKPTDGSGDFTFSRGTDTATRVNASGLIEKERGNLLLQSNTFDTTWINIQSSLSNGFSGYDGSSDAWRVVEDATIANHYSYQNSINTGVGTISVYAKSNGRDLQLRVDGVGTNKAFVNYDLSGGAIGLSGGTGLIDSSIESVGGGWYRCSFAVNDSGNYGMGIVCITDAATSTELQSYSGDGASGIYIQDAMLNQGLVPQPYIETTTAAVYEGITDNLPRLDYSGGASCPSLLLEPSRTNGNAHSEYFSGTGFGIVAATATANAATSPEGVTNATSFVGAASTAEHIIYTTGSTTYNGDVTISIFAKANGYDYFVLGAGAQSLNKPVLFNIANGTKVGNFTGWSSYGAPIDSDIEDYGDGWYRLSVTFAATSGVNTNMFFGSMPTDSVASGANVSTQNGTDGSYIYGASIESGSYVSSYIPTYGASASRAGDYCRKTGINSLIGGTSGTIFFDIKTNKTLTSNNYKQFFYYSDASTAQAYMYISDSNYIVGNPSFGNIVSGQTLQADTRYKIVLTYKQNDFKLYINGALSATRTSGNVIDAENIVSIGSYNGASEFNEFVFNSYMHFQSVLTDAECIALTTI
jgi:hypothetical protein